jgi:5-methylcytosine-specific restriction protein A
MVLPNDVGSGGKDTIDNTVDLCPNCHRKMHVLDLKGDKEKLNATGRIVEKLR